MPNADAGYAGHVPLAHHELDQLFAPLLGVEHAQLLAVSGGADSLALLILCHKWQQQHHPLLKLHVASVNHGLRPEAGDECAHVGHVASQLGLSHAILVWHPPEGLANLQSEARDARYHLLVGHALALGCTHLVIAHHLDDQAETFVMRLMRGSGVTGLSGMRARSERDGITLLRPFLGVPKSRLVASLKAEGIAWVDDPSNRQDDYLRVRVRGLLPEFAAEGCDAARLGATARRMERAEEALSVHSEALFGAHMRAEAGRALSIALECYADQLEEYRLRLLRLALPYVTGPSYPPREERLMALDAMLVGLGRQDRDKRTLGGCCFEVGQGRIWIYREPGRAPVCEPLVSGQGFCWFGIYDIHLPGNVEGATFRPLGPDGLTFLAKAGFQFAPKGQRSEPVPRPLVEALPSVWVDGEPMAVADWPQIAQISGLRVDFGEKNTRFTFNQPSL